MNPLIPADPRSLKRLWATLCLVLPLLVIDANAGLRISEFMASNDSTLLDEDGESSDWIEIYNPVEDNTAINLDGYALSDDPLLLQKWTFPDTQLAPGSRLVVFASGKDRAVTGSELHTNFSLERNGEFLALVAPDGITTLSVFDTYPEQFEDLSLIHI